MRPANFIKQRLDEARSASRVARSQTDRRRFEDLKRECRHVLQDLDFHTYEAGNAIREGRPLTHVSTPIMSHDLLERVMLALDRLGYRYVEGGTTNGNMTWLKVLLP